MNGCTTSLDTMVPPLNNSTLFLQLYDIPTNNKPFIKRKDENIVNNNENEMNGNYYLLIIDYLVLMN
jgi:hypothetical protein